MSCWPPDPKKPLNGPSQTPSYQLLVGYSQTAVVLPTGVQRQRAALWVEAAAGSRTRVVHCLCPAPLPSPLWGLETRCRTHQPSEVGAWHSKCILPKAPGSGPRRGSPGLRWGTSLHWEEADLRNVVGRGLAVGQGELLAWRKGTRGAKGQRRDLAGFTGGTSLEPTRCHR